MTDRPPDEARPIEGPRRTLFWSFCRSLARIGTSLAFELKVRGARHVPSTGGVLLVSNHQSFLDPILIGVQLYRPMAYLAKSELFHNPIFGRAIRALYAFPVKQGKGDVGAVKESIRLLKAGHMLNIFPEGSRCDDGKLQPILPGAALVIKRAGVPVVPVMIEGAFEAWRRGQTFPRSKPVWLEYGEPMQIAHLDARDIVRLIDQRFKEMHADVKAWRASDER